ncbi:MAG: 2,3-bisphosphoglycerate-independent phosphoglycerate mutase 2 [Candidatus Magasanikbacteria bacterium GW2011_GWA2_46_17]|uniref:2,3-bisphosphoglycerate-independent phosphoglycerate mutase n=1 Tax=Candidatus Magasanikbacteria bacterium GW2011_GWA2_46_17 TaxID=1619042 RepID=A0A0G1P1B6_9BACT|nr:MAG: 2,3-bisphosphoglycerate-independent phosphoglycerate mutase 2 [Candidatus Magasanikbacteria bacterium GW2011_GWA2_46_17]
MKKNKTTLLVIMDGWGIANSKNAGNPVTPDAAPHYFSWLKKFQHTELAASGEAVGLFKGQEGNSEAGHLNLGAGRVVKQDALYISESIADGTFFKNSAFYQALFHVKKYDSAVHLMGLLSNHNSAHSCPEHLYTLIRLFRENRVNKVYLHLFTDGRDSGQHDAPHHLQKLRKMLNGNEKIATVQGRFFAMDRNKNWANTKKTYEALALGKGCAAPSVEEALSQAYNRGETDEFICPTVIVERNKPVAKIQDNDAIFFFNLRSDRARQLTKVFVQPNFKEINPGAFTRQKFPKNTRFVAMTDFGPDLSDVLTAYPSRDVENSLVQTLCPKRQLYISESEKFAHVTYFFNGGYAQHFCDERWVKISSPEVDSYDKKPEMSARQVGDYVVKAIESGEYEFIAVNFANPDMVGHTGNFEAGKIAVRAVDREANKVIETLLKYKGRGIITADHGNVEEMINLKTGEIDTEHSTNPVPCFLVGIDKISKKLRKGKLADVAPTILKMMGMGKPKEMTGKALY